MHDLGPEIRRAISGSLDVDEFPEEKDVEEPMHRVMLYIIDDLDMLTLKKASDWHASLYRNIY